jgi:hypothetical protein
MRQTNQFGRQGTPCRDVLVLQGLKFGEVLRVDEVVRDYAGLMLRHVGEEDWKLSAWGQLSLPGPTCGQPDKLSNFVLHIFKLQQPILQRGIVP